LGPKKQFKYEGRSVSGQEIEFEARSPEPWTNYILEDGTTLKVKVILLSVIRLDEYSPDGQPIYQFTAQQIVGIQAPDELKKKPS